MSQIQTAEAERVEHMRGDQEKAGFEPTWVSLYPRPPCAHGKSLLWFDEMLKTICSISYPDPKKGSSQFGAEP